MQKIVMSWFISPALGGIVAALFLYGIKKLVLFRKDKVSAAKTWVPFFVAIMSFAFGAYIVLKGFKKVSFIDSSLTTAVVVGAILFALTFVLMRLRLKNSSKIHNDRVSVNKLFVIPLIFSAALLSFAHGANDVANAIGPLAAIYDAVTSGLVE